jgi:hypothetical protein
VTTRERRPFVERYHTRVSTIKIKAANVSNDAYYDVIKAHIDKLAFYAFYEMEHVNKFSPGWDNDKILMLVKN